MKFTLFERSRAMARMKIKCYSRVDGWLVRGEDLLSIYSPLLKSLLHKLLICCVLFTLVGLQGLRPLLMQAEGKTWDHDGHNHWLSVVQTGDAVILTLHHQHDDEEEDHDSVDGVHGGDADGIRSIAINCNTRSDHVVTISSGKFVAWTQAAASSKLSHGAIPLDHFDDANSDFAADNSLTIGWEAVPARPPPWRLFALQHVLRVTVMVV